MAMSCLFGNRACNACMRCVQPGEGEEEECRID